MGLRAIVGVVLASLTLAGCTSGTGTFVVEVLGAGARLADFASIAIDVQVLAITPRGGEAKRLDPNVGRDSFDLVEARGANATLLFSGNVPAGNYSHAELFLERAEGTFRANGTRMPILVPALVHNATFTVREGSEAHVEMDLEVHKSASGVYFLRVKSP